MNNKYIVSLKDIARETGVSVSTVSRVIKKKGEIAAETRNRVMQAARRLGYHDNRLIEGIRTGRTRTVGVMSGIDDYFFNRVVQGLHHELRRHGYLPILAWSSGEPDDEQETMHRLIEQRVDGIIMVPTYDLAETDYFLEVIERGLPLVTLDRHTRAAIDFIGTDDYLGGLTAAEHLYQLGHRHFVCYKGPNLASPAILRRQGFADYLEQQPDAVLHSVGDGGWTQVPLAILIEFFARHPEVTAAFAFNDNFSISLCDAAAKLGRRIPEDLAVVGFGDLPSGMAYRPRLTTLDQQPALIAEKAVARLFSLIDRENPDSPPVEIRIPPILRVRGSTATTDEPLSTVT